MTVVAGLISEGQVYLGADGVATGYEGRLYTRIEPKVFRLGGRPVLGEAGTSWTPAVVVGGSGIPRVLTQLRRVLAAGSTPGRQDLDAWLHDVLVSAIVEITKTPPLREDDGFSLLVGAHGRLFELDKWLDVMEVLGPITVGSGGEFAQGALDALAEAAPDLPPKQRLLRALEVATRHNAFCGPPFHFVTTASA